MQLLKSNQKSGFTLIELLVVIAIIGILSAVVLAALGSARESARDIRRVHDIRQINTAIQMYINDHGTPPPGDGGDFLYSSIDNDWSSLESDLSEYIDLPKDHNNTEYLRYIYGYKANHSSNDCVFDKDEDEYILFVSFESSSAPSNYRFDRIYGGYDRYCIIQ